MSRLSACLAVALFVVLPAPVSLAAQILADGEFELLFSNGPGTPNFNSAITLSHIVPADLGPTTGRHLILSLRDSSRPDQFCDPDDPSGGLFDGCATVDWPFPGRRGINLLGLTLDSGNQTLHLRMSDELADEPEPDGP